jgi:hypothetical protein
MSADEVQGVFVRLYEFPERFHNDHTDFGELHFKIEASLREKETELMEFFRRSSRTTANRSRATFRVRSSRPGVVRRSSSTVRSMTAFATAKKSIGEPCVRVTTAQ